MEIYTPNHGRFIDTLFTYGFIQVLERMNVNLERINIHPIGDYYLISNIDEIAPNEFYKELSSTFKDNYYGRAKEKNGRVLPLLGFPDEEKIIKEITSFLSNLSSLKQPPFSEVFSKAKDLVSWRESQCKQHAKQLHIPTKTLYMVAAPFLGKYQYTYNEYVPKAKKYEVCLLCASLIYLGLLTSSYSIRYNVRPPVWEYAIFIPTKECNAEQLNDTTQNRSEDNKQVIRCDEIPEIVLPILILYSESATFLESVLQSISPIFYSYRLISAQKRIGVWAVRSTSEHIIENFIKFLLKVKTASSKVENLMKLVRFSLYSQAFTNLAFSIINKDVKYFYVFLRELASQKRHSLIDEEFVNEALKFFLE